MKSPKRELVRAGCVEIVEESSTYTLRMEEVIPTPPQAIEVKMGVFVTSLVKVGNTVV